jgi:hypothetical protein
MKTERWELSIGQIPDLPALFDGLDVDEAAGSAFILEMDDSGDFREESVISADTYVDARLELGATLTNQNGAAGDKFAAKALHAQPL